ncbi:MAG: glycoside hydrolase family 28 protein [Clostridiales bacterium]|nr:glycoside hydrolase family 28 protein [Clostridiales bacterium]
MDFHVMSYGAKGDGVTDDAIYIQKAIDDCEKFGGGRVVLDGGRTFYSSSLILKENVELHLERGALLKASSDLDTYFRPNMGQKDEGVNIIGTPVTLKPSYAFIYAKDADNIAISGQGIIDGNCYAFVERVDRYYVTSNLYPRPTMIYFEHCNHISITDVTMQNAPFWTLHPAGCDDVLISKIRILNPLDVANSDGIDPDHCSNVRIIGCHITCADDAICLKSSSGNMEYGPTENIVIADCTLVSTSAALKIGTEGTGDFRNILVHNCILSKSNRGISIQIRDGGNVKNAIFSNIIIETRRFADCWWGCAEPIAISTHNRDENTNSGIIENITFENIICDSENGVFLSGSEENKIRDIQMINVQVNLSTKTKWKKGLYDLRPGLGKGIEETKSAGFMLRNVDGIVLNDCKVNFLDNNESFGDPIEEQECKNVEIRNFKYSGK